MENPFGQNLKQNKPKVERIKNIIMGNKSYSIINNGFDYTAIYFFIALQEAKHLKTFVFLDKSHFLLRPSVHCTCLENTMNQEQYNSS